MSRSPQTLPWGVALLSAGFVGFVVRYGVYPLDLGVSPFWRAAITGTLAASIVVGGQTVRRARKAGETVNPVRELLAALIPAAFVGALGLHFAPRGGASALVAEVTQGSGADVALEAHALPGLDVDLPPWEVAQERTDPHDGVVQLADPGGLDRHMKLEWKLAEPLPRAMLIDLFTQGLAGLKFEGGEPVQVADRSFERLYFRSARGGKKVAVTQWTCPDDPRTFSLISFLTLEPEALVRLHDRVLQSVRCKGLADVDAMQLRFPTLAGTTLAGQQPTGVLYTDDDGTSFFFTAGTGDPKMQGAFEADARLRRTLVSALDLQPANDAFEGAPETVGDPPRTVFAGRVRDPQRDETFTVLQTVFTCDDQAFIGFAIPESGDLPGDAAERLGAAACPQ